MATATGNTAQGSVLLQQGSEVAVMNKTEGMREARYQAAMHMARQLLKKGVIDEDDYAKFDTKMSEKYRPILGSLFSDLRLINLDK